MRSSPQKSYQIPRDYMSTCFGNGFSLSPFKVSRCLRALAIGDLPSSEGGGSGITSGSHSQMHNLIQLRGSKTEDGGISANRSGNDESDHLRQRRGNRSPRDWCDTGPRVAPT